GGELEALRMRLREEREELEAAEARNDLGQVERTRSAIEGLAVLIGRCLGLASGADQRNAERARQRVAKAITAAIRHVAGYHAPPGHHLRTSLRTGAFCSYDPDPTRRVRWLVSPVPPHCTSHREARTHASPTGNQRPALAGGSTTADDFVTRGGQR